MSYDIRRWQANARPATQRRRHTRWLLLAAMAAALLLALADTFSGKGMSFPSPAIFTVIVIAASTSPFMRETWFTARGQAAFDEWERDALFRATTRAYALMLGMVCVFFGWLWAGTALGWPVPHRPVDWGCWLLLALSGGLALPVTVAEFTLPMPPAEEDEA